MKMLHNWAIFKYTPSFSQVFFLACTASLIFVALPVNAQTNIANQRFLDNAIQFDDDEGLRTRTEGPGLGTSQQARQAPGVVVVTDSARTEPEIKEPKRSRGGFSFSDMAKSTQQAQQSRSGLSFGDMARSARRPKPRLQLRNKVPTSSPNLISR
jgi:hypothetical protein